MLADQETLPQKSIELVRKQLRLILVGEAQWDIELPLTFNSPWPRAAAVSVVLGVLLGKRLRRAVLTYIGEACDCGRSCPHIFKWTRPV